MSDHEPWECPRCHRINAPFREFCDCNEDGGSEVTLHPARGGGSGGTGAVVYVGDPPGGGTGVTWPGSGTGTLTWTGNTVIGRNVA